MIDCTLVTCEAVRTLDPDDRLLLEELRRRGMSVSVAAWSDPHVDWSISRLCILRSTWDYHKHPDEFGAWLDRVAEVAAIQNAPGLVGWNSHKGYLRELELRGVPVVPTVWILRGQSRRLTDLCEERGWHELVIKPARGAATHDVMLVGRDAAAFAKGQAHLDQLAQAQDVLVQPYLDEVVAYGERALIFFADRYSHAVKKKPFDTVLAVRSSFTAAADATSDEIEVAAGALAAIPGRSLYARVDLLRDADGNARVSELELIEPALYFGTHPPSRAAFADVVERELEATMRARRLRADSSTCRARPA
jgi:hypothetical protein